MKRDSFRNITKKKMFNRFDRRTKWCGPGDVAENYDDLGYFENVDRCCRAHDTCDDIIETGQTKYNLTNDSPFTT
ncbi:UNVERIFIED_CONTAM: Phospholipase A2 [Trichonephila clavipes]